jgi:hypothetical protein
MLSTFGVDVLDPGVSLRRVHVLVRRLPPGSLTAVESPAAWSTEAHLLARLNEATDLLTWVLLRVNGSKARKPKPLPRPGVAEARRPADAPKMQWGALAGALAGAGVTSNGR